jgi:hypothetical protein
MPFGTRRAATAAVGARPGRRLFLGHNDQGRFERW